MSIFAKARAGLNLTPAERAFLKLVEGWVIAGALSALVAFVTAVTQPNPNWRVVLAITATAFVTATAFAALKYVKAHLDPPLAAAVDAAAARLGVSDYGNKPATVVMPGPAMPTHTVVTWTPASPTTPAEPTAAA